MTINEAATAIEAFLATYDGGSARPVSSQAHPSGDDVDVIKIYVDLGRAKGVDTHAWAHACEAAIRAALPETKAWRLELRAEADQD
ncbi:MAG TPA: hypothetical protein VHE35_00720 [Kofleriaceae bacterium]|nr:hypothetical protein [Kofleriaceae bacterium]